MNFKTEQEDFWAGEFGDGYIDRNSDERRIQIRRAFFDNALETTESVSAILELGANIGQNISALQRLFPEAQFGAVEINQKAAEDLSKIDNTTVFQGSILDFTPEELGTYDLTFTSGVLIHINPEILPQVYQRLYECSSRYIMVSEYYNPTPVEVNYRGHEGRLFKRDFAGELLDTYKDLKLKDYGFQYHRDPENPMDDLNWFLLEKS